MELRDVWKFCRRWWWSAPLGLALGAGIALLITMYTTPTYVASTRLVVNQVSIPGLNDPQAGQTAEILKTYSVLLLSQPIIDETIKQLGLSLTPDQLTSRITVNAVRDSRVLEVTVTDTDPTAAAAIANRLATVFIAQNRTLQVGGTQDARSQIDQELTSVRQQIDDSTRRLNQLRPAGTTGTDPAGATDNSGEVARLQGELARYQELYFQLLDTRQRLALSQAQATSSVTIAEPARVPPAPIRPNRLQNLLIGMVLGLLVALGLAAAVEYIDDRIREPEEIRERLGLPPLATLSRSKFQAVAGRHLTTDALADDGRFTDEIRLLRTNLDFVVADTPRAILISSAVADEGKSTVAANLAIAEAQAGKRVVLIDADLRRPALHTLFALENDRGLSTFLAQSKSDELPPLQHGPDGLRILTSGPLPPNPTELLSTPRMAILIAYLRGQADVIILDSAPILSSTDTLAPQRYIEGTVLVAAAGHTSLRTIERALARMQQAGATVLGVALNKDTHQREQYDAGAPRPARAATSNGHYDNAEMREPLVTISRSERPHR